MLSCLLVIRAASPEASSFLHRAISLPKTAPVWQEQVIWGWLRAESAHSSTQQWQGPGNAWFDSHLAVFPVRGASSQQDKHTSSLKNQGIRVIEGTSTKSSWKVHKTSWCVCGCLPEAILECFSCWTSGLWPKKVPNSQGSSHLSQNTVKPFNLLSRKFRGVINTLKARSSKVFRNQRHSYMLFPLYVTSLTVQKYSHQDFA